MGKIYGHNLFSEDVKDKIDQLVELVSDQSKKITGIKNTADEVDENYQGLLDRIAKYRGRPLFHPYVGSGLGNGIYVELENGDVKMDLINGIGVHILGHSHPKLIRSGIEAGLSDIVSNGNLQANQEYLEFGEKLLSLAKKSRLKHAWLTTSGSMANENALKMARQKKSPARLVLAMSKAFAGRSTMMAEITDNPKYKVGLPDYSEVLRLPFCNKFEKSACKSACFKESALSKLKEIVAQNENNISAFVFEPILGEGGYLVPCREFFPPLLDFCKQKGIPVWADEVQTFLRTGEAFAFQTLGFEEYVDIATVAKTVQVGATLFTEEFNPKPGLVSGTFAGSVASLKAGIAIMDELSNGKYFGPGGRIKEIQSIFVEKLNALAKTTCKGMMSDIDGVGLMLAFTPFDGSIQKTISFIKRLYKNGILTLGCGRDPYRVRFLLPAIISNKDIDDAIKIIEQTFMDEA